MSCDECDKEQENRDKEYYFRVGKANILVFGCEEHVDELQKIIRGEK